MASRMFRKIQGLNHGEVRVSGSFRPNGSSAVSASNNVGEGFTVARTSAGLFTLTFADKYPNLIAFNAHVRSADGVHVAAVAGDYSATDKTMQVRLRKGAPVHVPLPLSAAREIASDAYQNLAAVGGLMASDSTPILERVNGATDKAARLRWAATVVDEIQWDGIMVPRAAETANAVTVDLMIEKGSNTDTAATIDVQAFSGKGDTEMGAATTALSSATLGRKSVTLAAADVGAWPGFLNIALVPSAHANDAIHLYGASLEFETLIDLASDADNAVHFEAIFGNLSFT